MGASTFIFLAIVFSFIFLILLASRNTSNKGIYLTENDLVDFQSQVKEVQQIAGIRSPNQSPNPSPVQSPWQSPNHSPWQSESIDSSIPTGTNKFIYPPNLPIGDNRVGAGYKEPSLDDYYKPLIN